MTNEYFAHETAVVDEGASIGKGSKIWHFSHIMPGAVLGDGCNIGQNVVISPDVVLGKNCKVQNNVSIYTGVTCDDDVFMGPSMVFTNIVNPRSAVVRRGQYARTHVGRGASIGANATIVCGHDIGPFAFIGAGAVVTKTIPAYALVVGNPARQVGWMSEYGHRLEFDEAGRAQCEESKEWYNLEDGIVKRSSIMVLIEREKIHFAVVGAGHIGKRHCTMIMRNPEAELVGISDVKAKEELGLDDFGDIPFFQSVDDLLTADLDIDVVVISSPNGLHAEQAMKALDAKKHVVIEKPMALSKQDAEKVIYKALHVSRHVFGVMQNRYSPPSAWIKEMIEEGRLGDIYMVQVNCYWNRDERYYGRDTWHGDKKLDGGTLFTQFSHFIDIMYWLFGDIENIQGQFADFNHADLTDFEDSGMVQFEFVNGGMGCINYSTSVWNQNLESSLTVIGEKGSVKIGGQYMNEVEVCNVQDYEMPELPPANPANDYGAYKGSAANHVYITENVVDTLKGRTSITTNALEGLKVVDIIERIYASMKH